jgi:hypothetical protein
MFRTQESTIRVILLHPNNIKREDGFSLIRSWSLSFATYGNKKKRLQTRTRRTPVSPEKGYFLL